MPYMIYKVFADKKLEYLGEHAKFKEAKEVVNGLRREIGEFDNYLVRMIHAKDQAQAERLLTEERERPPAGDD
jgi:hypothetical protein